MQKAADRLLLIEGSKTANEALEDAAAAVAAEAVKSLSDRVRPVQNVASSLQLTSYLFSIGGNKDAARTIGGLANAADGVANLMQNAATASPMMLASGYVGVALTVYSAFQSSKEGPSPFPALFEMLGEISQQIEDLRRETANNTAALDAHLGSTAHHRHQPDRPAHQHQPCSEDL